MVADKVRYHRPVIPKNIQHKISAKNVYSLHMKQKNVLYLATKLGETKPDLEAEKQLYLCELLIWFYCDMKYCKTAI